MSKRSNIENQRFGHLVALCPTRSNKRGQMYWLCKCDCGNEKEILSTHLLSGKIKSCGCAKNTVDGLSIKYPRLYSIYYGMIKRCYDINNEAYKNYGGRGIRVCNEWVREPNNFIKWAFKIVSVDIGIEALKHYVFKVENRDESTSLINFEENRFYPVQMANVGCE